MAAVMELAGTDSTYQAACVIGIPEIANRYTRKIEMNQSHDKERLFSDVRELENTK